MNDDSIENKVNDVQILYDHIINESLELDDTTQKIEDLENLIEQCEDQANNQNNEALAIQLELQNEIEELGKEIEIKE